MNNLGFGVMLHRLSGNHETVDAHNAAVGKEIANISLVDNKLILTFTDKTGIYFFDDGQSCCEERWMATDDKLDDFIGAKFLGADLRDGPEPTMSGEYDEWHEEQFLLINTSIGTFTMVNYNEHNGYYGGFAPVCRVLGESHV